MPEGARFCPECGKDQTATYPPEQRIQTPSADVPPPQQHPPQQPQRRVGCGMGGCLVLVALFVVGGCLSAIGGAGDDQTQPVASKATKEQAAKEDAQEPANSDPKGQQTREKTHKKTPLYPEPRTDEEEILYALHRMGVEEKKVSMEITGEACKMVTFGYKTPFVGSSLPSEASDYHKAVFYSADLQQRVCLVKTNAYGSTTDDFGNNKRVLLYSTSLKRDQAEKVNWQNYYSVNFSRLYQAEYMHPSAKADIAQENARRAVDCLEDQGMFDFDLDC